jgi:serine/threonine-protein kinase
MPLTSGTIIEGYEIIETLGTGAMSTVYLAKKDDNHFAVKELKSEFASPDEEKILINAFHRETELLFHISHPGIPKLYKNFTINKKSYIVMEYIKCLHRR